MPQDVSIKDISTIRIFANSLNHFCSDYASKLQSVGRQASSDSGKADFRLFRFQTDLQEAEVKLRHATREMEHVEQSESATPREFNCAMKELSIAQIDYERRKELFERAQQVVKQLQAQLKQVEEISSRMRHQLNDASYNARTVITAAINKLQEYAK